MVTKNTAHTKAIDILLIIGSAPLNRMYRHGARHPVGIGKHLRKPPDFADTPVFYIASEKLITYSELAIHTEGTVSIPVIELAEQIKEKGQRSTAELPELLKKAEALAEDETQDALTRGLAHRAAGNAHQLLNQFESALKSYDNAALILERMPDAV